MHGKKRKGSQVDSRPANRKGGPPNCIYMVPCNDRYVKDLLAFTKEISSIFPLGRNPESNPRLTALTVWTLSFMYV
ncbi:MAG: hypothetical protein KC964_09345 [Candidatus Omnitrophica bacterium]|nr:hypothetical protein [Candidatus Omnitrophota bacterium]MCA9440996.1 hypothetical protein [Candidatus Omnitrophota bacterium]